MSAGGEGELTLTVRMKVSPEPEDEQAILDLMRRYRDALNYSIRSCDSEQSAEPQQGPQAPV